MSSTGTRAHFNKSQFSPLDSIEILFLTTLWLERLLSMILYRWRGLGQLTVNFRIMVHGLIEVEMEVLSMIRMVNSLRFWLLNKNIRRLTRICDLATSLKSQGVIWFCHKKNLSKKMIVRSMLAVDTYAKRNSVLVVLERCGPASTSSSRGQPSCKISKRAQCSPQRLKNLCTRWKLKTWWSRAIEIRRMASQKSSRCPSANPSSTTNKRSTKYSATGLAFQRFISSGSTSNATAWSWTCLGRVWKSCSRSAGEGFR